ncbi:hypothetical protein SO802_014213 [Lithocarpus litseifolius]|uniref:Uncharacterized protein n=1 Tax=Lithocarpus litseifolius TaxID=425828 RepID=A0AAW2CQR8_9ROSI
MGGSICDGVELRCEEEEEMRFGFAVLQRTESHAHQRNLRGPALAKSSEEKSTRNGAQSDASEDNPVLSETHFTLFSKVTVLKFQKPISENHKQNTNESHFPKDDDRPCKFFKWLDTSVCCTCGAAIAPIVIAKFNRLEHAVEVANEELKQAHALAAAALERERVTKRKYERAKAARMISEEKAKKLTIALLVLRVMFLVLLILSTRLGEVKIRQMCLP